MSRWKGLVNYYGLGGNHPGIVQWNGLNSTSQPQNRLIEGDITGTITGMNLLTNWGRGTLKWLHNTGTGIAGDWGTHLFEISNWGVDNNNLLIGLSSSGGNSLTTMSQEDGNNLFNYSGKFCGPVTRNWTMQGNNSDKHSGPWVGAGFTTRFQNASDGNNSDAWGSTNYGEGTMLWDISVGSQQNAGSQDVSIFPRQQKLSLTSGTMPINAQNLASTSLGPLLEYSQAGSASKWGPFWDQTTGKVNHQHDGLYLEQGARPEQFEVISDSATVASDGIEGAIYLGPNQFVTNFTDTSGDTWYIYNFFKQFQGGEDSDENGVYYHPPIDGATATFQSTSDGQYFYQLGGSPSGSTTLGASSSLYEKLIDWHQGDHETASGSNTTMTIPFPGGNRRPIWSTTKIEQIQDYYQALYNTGNTEIRLKIHGIAYSIDGDTSADTNLSGTRGASGTFWIEIDTTSVGSEITVYTKYCYPFFYSPPNSTWLAGAELASDVCSLKVWSNPDANERNNRCVDSGAGAPFDGESNVVSLSNTTNDWAVLGRFFIIKVANSGGGNTCNNTFDPSALGDNDRLQFRFENLRRCLVQDAGSGFCGNALAPSNDFPTGSGLTIDNANHDPVTFNLSSSAYGPDTDLTAIQSHCNAISGLQTIGDTDGQMVLSQGAGVNDYMIAIQSSGAENCKMYVQAEPAGSIAENTWAQDDGFSITVQSGPAATGEEDWSNRQDGKVSFFTYFGMSTSGDIVPSSWMNTNANPGSTGTWGSHMKEWCSLALDTVDDSNAQSVAFIQIMNALVDVTGTSGNNWQTELVGAQTIRPTAEALNEEFDIVPGGGGHVLVFPGGMIDKNFYSEGNLTSVGADQGTTGTDDKIFVAMPSIEV